ncbi:TetR family transcriptional regulator [Kribbella orskensis]|uniref:TetR family transcriptional regulator n=1 Tax=Kribbella orskensis TaxID=2512216 RepID=A0ABY2BD45_9ACTN|nr:MULTISPECIES: TetR/AcrR family transcriptional regulator [Kribbella]TCN35370.1 TetR family transcriptional regulator [Kribbella sp. VKM Ac-2500]TCO16791.1 TetR family transcriptional regulator [Kribbella orskensis]
MTVKRLRERQAEATRELLVGIARERFVKQGYAATAMDDIVQRAGLAKGALYHHFSGKDALFKAVYDVVLDETAGAVMAAALAEEDPWAAVRAGLSAFLDACLRPAFRRIVIIDSVTVLAARAWESGTEGVELPMLRTVLTPLVDSGALPGVTLDALAHLALGGLYGSALYIARAADPEAARVEADVVLDVVLRGVRAATT